MFRNVILLILLTSCASVYKPDYTKSAFKEKIKLGLIEKVDPDFSCFKDDDLQEQAVYWNFYNSTVEEVSIWMDFIDTAFNMRDGGYFSDSTYSNNNGFAMITKVEGQANLFSTQYAVCHNSQIVENLNNRRGIDYSQRFNPYSKNFNISVKIVPGRIIQKFLKDKISYEKINNELRQANREHKFNDKVELYCLDENCSFREQRGYISSYDVNIVKRYSRNFTGGFIYNINYGYVVDTIKEIETSKNVKLREFYEGKRGQRN